MKLTSSGCSGSWRSWAEFGCGCKRGLCGQNQNHEKVLNQKVQNHNQKVQNLTGSEDYLRYLDSQELQVWKIFTEGHRKRDDLSSGDGSGDRK